MQLIGMLDLMSADLGQRAGSVHLGADAGLSGDQPGHPPTLVTDRSDRHPTLVPCEGGCKGQASSPMEKNLQQVYEPAPLSTNGTLAHAVSRLTA